MQPISIFRAMDAENKNKNKNKNKNTCCTLLNQSWCP